MSIDVGKAIGYLDLDTSGFTSGFDRALQNLKVFEDKSSTFSDKLSGIGSSMTSAGKSLTTSVTLPIVGLGAAAVKTAADFDSAMSEVSAISGATGTDFELLRDKAAEMGAKTKFSASESAEAMKYMAMAGWKTEDMLEGIEGIMNLAAASGENLGSVSDIVTDALTAFGLSAKDSAHFSDVLAAASNNANTNVSMLGESFKYVAPVAGALGFSVEDTSVALGLMANSGIKASQAGTALRTTLTNMAKPTDDMQYAMDALGVSLTDGEGNMKSFMDIMKDLRSGFKGGQITQEEYKESYDRLTQEWQNGTLKTKDYAKALNQLRIKLDGTTEAEQAELAAMLAGKEGMSGLLAIVNTSDEDFQKLSDSIYAADGTAQKMADTMLDNLGGQLTILKSTLEGIAISFGDILMPAIRKVTEKLQEFAEWLNNLSDEEKEQIVKIAAIAAAIGPALLVLGKLFSTLSTISSTVSKVIQGFKLFGLSLPTVAIVAGIAAIAAAFITLWNTNEEFREKITEIWNGIKEKFQEFGQTIVDKLNEMGFDFENFGEVIKAAWQAICDFLAPIFEGAFQLVQDVLGTALDVLVGLFDVFAGIFTGDWERVWNGIKEIFSSIWEGIKKVFTTVTDTIKKLLGTWLDDIKKKWEERWNKIKTFFSDTWDKMKTGFTKKKEEIGEKIKGFVNDIKDWFSKLPENLLSIGKNLVEGLWNGIKSMWNWVNEKITGFANGIINGFKNIFGIASPSKVMKSQGSFLMQGLANGISSSVGLVKSQIGAVADTINDTLDEAFDTARTIKVDTDFTTDDAKSAVHMIRASSARTSSMQGSSQTENTYNFYSPEAVTPTKAAKLLRQTAQQMSLGFT